MGGRADAACWRRLSSLSWTQQVDAMVLTPRHRTNRRQRPFGDLHQRLDVGDTGVTAPEQGVTGLIECGVDDGAGFGVGFTGDPPATLVGV